MYLQHLRLLQHLGNLILCIGCRKVVLVDFLDKSASNTVLLVRRKYKDLRNCDRSLWNLLELIKCCRVGDKFMVHVD